MLVKLLFLIPKRLRPKPLNIDHLMCEQAVYVPCLDGLHDVVDATNFALKEISDYRGRPGLRYFCKHCGFIHWGVLSTMR